MRKKSELIRQIHAMETVPIIRANFLDLTETSGLGLLSEMSIVEVCNGRRCRLGSWMWHLQWGVISVLSVQSNPSNQKYLGPLDLSSLEVKLPT